MTAMTLKGTRRGAAAAVVCAALVTAACTQGGGLNRQTIGAGAGAVAGGLIGSTIGAGGGRTAAIIVGGLIGALVGSEIGRVMDENDRLRAERATSFALEEGRSNTPVEWRNPDTGHYGLVTPQAPYRRGGQVCRDYTHAVVIGGRRETIRGVACRNPDGTWTAVS